MRPRLSPIFGIFLTVFIDLMSFGLFIPDLQLRAESLGAEGIVRGLVIASFSIAQFFVAPVLGRKSDVIGRRKILLLSSFLGIISFSVYANANVLWLIFLSRIISGAAAANVSVAFAYVADVTTPENRAKGLGAVGAAFGLGFILGPPLGGILLKIGHDKPQLLGYTAAAICLINFLYILFFLPESLKPENVQSAKNQESTIGAVVKAFQTPELSLLLALFFVANFAFANLESTYFLLSVREFLLTKTSAAYILGYVGFVIALVQGVILQIASRRYNEVQMLRFGYLCTVPALALIPWLRPWWPQLGILFVLAVGNGFANPSISSLISRNAPADMQGSIFGVNQSLGALARIVGPLVGSALFDIGHWLPYAAAALITCVPLPGAWKIKLQAQPEGSEVSVGVH